MNKKETLKGIDKFNLLKNAENLHLLKVKKTRQEQLLVCLKSGDETIPIAKILSDKEVSSLRPIALLENEGI